MAVWILKKNELHRHLIHLRQLCEKTTKYNEELNIPFVSREKSIYQVDKNIFGKLGKICRIKGQLLDNISELYQKC